jgi:hypothetical protein
MPTWLIPLLTQLTPLLVSMLAPILTSLAESLTAYAGQTLPNPAKPVINGAAGVGLATMVGGNPVVGVVGAMLGNRVREAMKAKPIMPPPIIPPVQPGRTT